MIPTSQADIDQRSLDPLAPGTGCKREGSQKIPPSEMWLILSDGREPLPTIVAPSGKMGGNGGNDRNMFVCAGRSRRPFGQYRSFFMIAA
jgi:hypothetical protein